MGHGSRRDRSGGYFCGRRGRRAAPGFQGNMRVSVFITSFSFATYVAARITKAALRQQAARSKPRPNAWAGGQDG